MKPSEVFNFPEISDFPAVCNTITTTLKFGMEPLQRVLKEPTGLSDEVIYRVRNFVEAYNNLIKACVPEGCSI